MLSRLIRIVDVVIAAGLIRLAMLDEWSLVQVVGTIWGATVVYRAWRRRRGALDTIITAMAVVFVCLCFWLYPAGMVDEGVILVAALILGPLKLVALRKGTTRTG
jgi:hypothetical protein